MWTLRVVDDNGTVWDETSYGGNSANKMGDLKADIQYMLDNPNDLAGNHITLTYTK